MPLIRGPRDIMSHQVRSTRIIKLEKPRIDSTYGSLGLLCATFDLFRCLKLKDLCKLTSYKDFASYIWEMVESLYLQYYAINRKLTGIMEHSINIFTYTFILSPEIAENYINNIISVSNNRHTIIPCGKLELIYINFHSISRSKMKLVMVVSSTIYFRKIT